MVYLGRKVPWTQKVQRMRLRWDQYEQRDHIFGAAYEYVEYDCQLHR